MTTSTIRPLPRLVFDHPAATTVTAEVDAICQRGIDAFLSYLAAARPGRAEYALMRAEMDARRLHLETQAQAIDELLTLVDPDAARLREAMRP